MLNTNFSSWPSFTKEEVTKVAEVLYSNKVNYWTGDQCRNFEIEFAEYFESKYAIALANGTVAIDLALKALDISEGDEVIVTSRTFLASVSSIVNAGAKPVFVDICANSQNIRTSEIVKSINSNTKAILCVHLAGWPCEMDSVMSVANKYNLYVIEDCAQAHGAKYKGKSVGSIGHIGCWSFCQDKIMTTGGEGGMVTTNDNSLWKKMWAFKDHGKSYDAVYNTTHPDGFRWLHESFGTNWRMTEIQGCIGRIQLKKMPEWTELRNLYQSMIWNQCKNLTGIRTPKFNEESWEFYNSGNIHAAYKCYVFVDEEKLKPNWSRDKIVNEIISMGVPCYSGSCSEVYLEKAFQNTDYIPKTRLKNAKKLGETSLMFLVHPTLSLDEIRLTCNAIESVIKKAAIN
jgi:dTDP-4-amino-4,6-dideoxygalactose transaminase